MAEVTQMGPVSNDLEEDVDQHPDGEQDVEYYMVDDDGNEQRIQAQEADAMIPSFISSEYQSQEMKRLIAMHEPDEALPPGLSKIDYSSSDIFPDWILTNSMWKNAPKKAESNEISDILAVPVSKRTQDQVSTLIHWLMSVWQNANSMGFKRCGAMFKEFNYNVFQPGDNIITEGERGLTFYIIVSGMTHVLKEGLGVVAQLGKGKRFGEIALTEGKDLRTATVQAQTRVEVLSLHKQNYDIFVRDIIEIERRENFQLLANCTLFKSWPKGKIEKMCNTCMRKTFEGGQYIFRQGDPPDDLLIVVEGGVNIFKELVIITKNRWPVGVREWKQRVRRVTRPIMLKTLFRGEYFGEIAILKNQPRSTSAIAQNRCVLLSIDKAEFLHLLNISSLPTKNLSDEQAALTASLAKYYDDQQVMETVSHIKGGPQSMALVGTVKIEKAAIDQKALRDYGKDADDLQQDFAKPNTAPAGITHSHQVQHERQHHDLKQLAKGTDQLSSDQLTEESGQRTGQQTRNVRSARSGRGRSSSPNTGRRPGTTGSTGRASSNRRRSPTQHQQKQHQQQDAMRNPLDPEYLQITRRQSVAEQIRVAVVEAKSAKTKQLQERQLDYSRAFIKGSNFGREQRFGGHRPMSPTTGEDLIRAQTQPLINATVSGAVGGPVVTNGALSPPSKAKLRAQSQQLLRNKLDEHVNQRKGSISFQPGLNGVPTGAVGGAGAAGPVMSSIAAAALAAANAVGLSSQYGGMTAFPSALNMNAVAGAGGGLTSTTGSPSIHPTRRTSLQGLDNDASTTFAFDPNRMVMRRNSAIRLGQVYEHVYQRIQLETAAESAASAAAARLYGSSQLIPRTASYDFIGGPNPAALNTPANRRRQSVSRGISRQNSFAGASFRGSFSDLNTNNVSMSNLASSSNQANNGNGHAGNGRAPMLGALRANGRASQGSSSNITQSNKALNATSSSSAHLLKHLQSGTNNARYNLPAGLHQKGSPPRTPHRQLGLDVLSEQHSQGSNEDHDQGIIGRVPFASSSSHLNNLSSDADDWQTQQNTRANMLSGTQANDPWTGAHYNKSNNSQGLPPHGGSRPVSKHSNNHNNQQLLQQALLQPSSGGIARSNSNGGGFGSNSMMLQSSSGAATEEAFNSSQVGGGGNDVVRIRRPTRRNSAGLFEPYSEATGQILQGVIADASPALQRVASAENIMIQQASSPPQSPKMGGRARSASRISFSALPV